MALINNTTELNEYVSVSSNLLEAKILKFTNKAERKLRKIIGDTKFDEIAAKPKTDSTRILFCEYVSNMGLSLALPSMVLNITNHGTYTTEMKSGQKAEWWQLKDLNRSLLKSAFDSLDDAIEVIGIKNVVKTKDLYIGNLTEFENYYSLGGSAQTFISLIPLMREAQEQFINSKLGECASHTFTKEELNSIKGAIANITIAKAVSSGAFQIETNSILLRIEVMPWEKVENVEQSRLEKLAADRMVIADGYLKQFHNVLKNLPCYEKPADVNSIVKHQSGLYLQ